MLTAPDLISGAESDLLIWTETTMLDECQGNKAYVIALSLALARYVVLQDVISQRCHTYVVMLNEWNDKNVGTIIIYIYLPVHF